MKTISAVFTVGIVACGLAFADETPSPTRQGGACRSPEPQAPSLFQDGQRIVILGDSLTFDGRYTHYLETFFLTRYPDRKLDFINVGLPSEGVTGLSEPAHPFPRPNVHERLGRVLEKLKPDVVIACYGMNDGIYHPFSEERFAAYKKGIGKLIADVTATGAKIILLTPPPFDPLPVADKLRGDDAGEYSWTAPYRDYDQVMAKYSQWLLTLGDPRVSLVVDTRTPTLQHLEEQRKQDAAYTLSPDGVHCNATGQWLIARALIAALEGEKPVPQNLETAFPTAQAQVLEIVGRRQVLIGRAWTTHIGHKRPQTPEGAPLEEALPKAVELQIKARELGAGLQPEQKGSEN